MPGSADAGRGRSDGLCRLLRLALALGPDHLVGVDCGEAEAGSEVLGHDLDLGPEGVVVGLPAALVQTAVTTTLAPW